MEKSTRKRSARKPHKPYPGFPLFPHATGRWAKKIRGAHIYFGKIADDPDGAAALERFNREWPYLKEGRTPPPLDGDGGCTIVDLVNTFLSSKRDAVENGELSERAFAGYHRCCEWLLRHLDRHRCAGDLRPEDFAALRSSIVKRKDGRGRGPVTVRNEINRIRALMKFACDHRLIDKPVHDGQSFNRPSAKTLRRAQQSRTATVRT